MVAASFDPTHAVRFDLPHGTVCAGDEDDPVLLVPAEALNSLVRAVPPEAVEALARAMGSPLGKRVAARIAQPEEASVEAFVTELAGQAALCGLGALRIERWGHALVVVVERSPLAAMLLGPLVASAIEAASGRRVRCAVLTHDERAIRVFVGSDTGVSRLRQWQASGVSWAAALARLHGETA
jgi:hypothetical protein